jgi:putative transposase
LAYWLARIVTTGRFAIKPAGANYQGRSSDATIYAWRKHFGQMQANDVKRLKALELENARLKKLLAERDLDIEVLKEINAKKW